MPDRSVLRVRDLETVLGLFAGYYAIAHYYIELEREVVGHPIAFYRVPRG